MERTDVINLDPTATPTADVPAATGDNYVGLPDTTINIHISLPFNFHISDPKDEIGKVDYVGGSTYATEPRGVYNTSYYPYDRAGNQGHDITWFKAHHPDWIEYQCDRRTIAYEFGDPNPPLDITNPAVLNYMWSTYLAPRLQAGYAGIMFDNLSLNNSGHWTGRRCGHFTPTGAWVQQFAGTSNDPAYRQAVLTWAKTMHERLHAAFPNATMSGNFSFDPSYAADSYTLYQYLDIVVDEKGFTNEGESGNNYLTGDDWKAKMQALQYLASVGKGWSSTNQEPERFANISNTEVQWVLANYLLVKGRHSFVFITGVQEYGYLYLRPEYAAQIGSPIGAMSAKGAVYFRNFTHGLAIVNPSASHGYTVQLPANTYKDLYGHTLANGSITLGPHSGIVLLNA
ncbi:MAG: putative glycoside hydrolase [Ktedonobacterales bacterium]